MLCDQVGYPRPSWQGIERLYETRAEHHARPVSTASRPPERVKLRHEAGDFRRIENCGDFGSDRTPWYPSLLPSESIPRLVTPPAASTARGRLFSLAKLNQILKVESDSTGPIGDTRKRAGKVDYSVMTCMGVGRFVTCLKSLSPVTKDWAPACSARLRW